MFIEWLIVGECIFWVAIAVLSIAFVACVHNRREGFAIFLAVVFAGVCVAVGDLGRLVINNLAVVLVTVCAYPLVGVAWTIPRWILFLDSIKRSYLAKLTSFVGKSGKLTEDKWVSWSIEMGCDPFYDAGMYFNSKTGKLTPPQYTSNKERIAGWIVLWPWSMVDALLGDLLARFFRWLVDLLSHAYQRLSNWVFSDLQ
jgi:hypothetical protein